jgi:hypothetical protein
MKSAIGGIFTVVGWIGWIVLGIWGFLLDLSIISHAAGFWGVVIGFFVAPVTFIAAPWYAGIAWGNWFPVLICYGGGIVASIFMVVGKSIHE